MRATLLALLLASGCAARDFERVGTWSATGVNDANLRAMVADPATLTRGIGATTSRGLVAGQAVSRLDEDRRRPLPDSRAAQVGALGGGAPTAPPNAN